MCLQKCCNGGTSDNLNDGEIMLNRGDFLFIVEFKYAQNDVFVRPFIRDKSTASITETWWSMSIFLPYHLVIIVLTILQRLHREKLVIIIINDLISGMNSGCILAKTNNSHVFFVNLKFNTTRVTVKGRSCTAQTCSLSS